MNQALQSLNEQYLGLSSELTEFGWEIIKPEE